MADAPAGLRGLSTALGRREHAEQPRARGSCPPGSARSPATAPPPPPKAVGAAAVSEHAPPSFPPDEAEGHQHRELSGTPPTGSSPFLPVSRSTDTQGPCRGHRVRITEHCLPRTGRLRAPPPRTAASSRLLLRGLLAQCVIASPYPCLGWLPPHARGQAGQSSRPAAQPSPHAGHSGNRGSHSLSLLSLSFPGQSEELSWKPAPADSADASRSQPGHRPSSETRGRSTARRVRAHAILPAFPARPQSSGGWKPSAQVSGPWDPGPVSRLHPPDSAPSPPAHRRPCTHVRTTTPAGNTSPPSGPGAVRLGPAHTHLSGQQGFNSQTHFSDHA